MSDKLNLDFLFNSFYIFSLSRYLVVLDETNVVSTLTEALSLHVDTVLADKSHTSLTSGNSALTASLSVSTGVSVIKLVRNTCLGHFILLKKEGKKLVFRSKTMVHSLCFLFARNIDISITSKDDLHISQQTSFYKQACFANVY